MSDPKQQKEFQSGRGYSREDWDEVSDSPEWTEDELAAAKPFAEVFPDWAARMAAGEASGIEYVGVDVRVVERLRERGPDWQAELNIILRRAVGL